MSPVRGAVTRSWGPGGRGYTPPVPGPILRVIPLGGLGEVGKNMTLFEHEHGSLVVDAGLAFPRDEHLGVDLVLPDLVSDGAAGPGSRGCAYARARGPRR